MLPASTITPERANPQEFEGLSFGEFVHRSLPLAFDYARVYIPRDQDAVGPLITTYLTLWRSTRRWLPMGKKPDTSLITLFRELRKQALNPDEKPKPVNLEGYFSIASLGEVERSVLVLALRYGLTPDQAGQVLETSPEQTGRIYLRAKTAAWELADAIHIWTNSRNQCPRLMTLTAEHRPDETLVTPILRHADNCEICKSKLGTGPDPLHNLPSMQADLPTRMTRRTVYNELEYHGIPTQEDENTTFFGNFRRIFTRFNNWWTGATNTMRAGSIAAVILIITLLLVFLTGNGDDSSLDSPNGTSTQNPAQNSALPSAANAPLFEEEAATPQDPTAPIPVFEEFKVSFTPSTSSGPLSYDVTIKWDASNAERSIVSLNEEETPFDAGKGSHTIKGIDPGTHTAKVRVSGPGHTKTKTESVTLPFTRP